MNDNAEMKLSIMLSLFRLRAPSITLLTTWLFSCWGRLIPMRFLASSRGESAVLHPASKAASQRRLSSTRPLHRHRAGFEHPTGGGAMNQSAGRRARRGFFCYAKNRPPATPRTSTECLVQGSWQRQNIFTSTASRILETSSEAPA